MSRHVLIDGDVLVYESSFGAQRNRYTVTYNGGERTFENAKDRDAWLKAENLKDSPELYTVTKHLDVLEESAALAICKNKLAGLLEKLQADTYHVYLTGKGNFREQIATLAPYKGNRADVEKPVHFAACREWFENHQNSSVTHGQEADDAIGIEQTKRGGRAIIASIDKDLRQLHGPHYEWHKEAKFNINADASDRWFWLQMLMGDSADNIPGIKGIGPAKSDKMLADCATRYQRAARVGEAYAKQYGETWRDWANEVGALLWIRRAEGQVWRWQDYVSNLMVET